MVVDVHTHTPRRKSDAGSPAAENAAWRPDQTRPTSLTWREHMDLLAPVSRAVVFNIAANPASPVDDGGLIYPTPRVNDDTAEFVRAFPDKLIGFMTVHPHDPGCLDEVDRGRDDLNLHGIKLGPNYQNFDPLGEAASRLFARAEELGLPVLLHQGTSPDRFADLDFAHPRHIDRVATRFPQLRMVLAHMGHPWQVDCITVIRKHPNVYADISAQFYRPWGYFNAFRAATEWGVLHKLLFGSDLPIATPQETMDALWRVNDVVEGTSIPRVPEKDLEGILERDTLSLLGIG
jgi:uncharacterized protein